MSNTPFRFCSAFLIVIANALDEVGAVPLFRDLRDLRVKPADSALRPLRRRKTLRSKVDGVYSPYYRKIKKLIPVKKEMPV